MPFAEWTKLYSVHVQRLDQQHQHMFAVVNQLHEAVKAGHGKAVLQTVFAELVRYSQEHFRDEEALMRQAEFSGLSAHVAEHQQFVARTEEFCNLYASGAPDLSVEVLVFLKDWLLHHITGTDRKYSHALNAHGIH